MSSHVNKNYPTKPRNLAENQQVKCVKFSKTFGDGKPIKSGKNDKFKTSCIRTVNNTDRSIKSCASSVVGFDLTDSNENDDTACAKNDQVSSELFDDDHYCELAVPELCTSLKIANNMLGAVASAKNSRTGFSLAAKNHEKNVAVTKSKALTVPFEELVYKDLIALNSINSSDVTASAQSQVRRCRVRFAARSTKDSEPQLAEHFNPEFGDEFLVECAPANFECFDRNVDFDGFAISKRASHWQSDE